MQQPVVLTVCCVCGCIYIYIYIYIHTHAHTNEVDMIAFVFVKMWNMLTVILDVMSKHADSGVLEETV